MAGRIITDLRDMQADAWVDWQIGDPSRTWASFALNDTRQTFTYLKRFYGQAGFSRYIRPGAIFVDVNNVDMVAAVSADGRTLALVVRNGDTAASKGFTFDLTALPSVGATAEAHRTSRSENLVSLTAVAIQDWSFVATVSPGSITTFVVAMPTSQADGAGPQDLVHRVVCGQLRRPSAEGEPGIVCRTQAGTRRRGCRTSSRRYVRTALSGGCRTSPRSSERSRRLTQALRSGATDSNEG
jgi:hypothetical protein